MKKSNTILLGLATVWPFLYMILFFLFVFSAIFLGQGDGDGIPIMFGLILPLHFLTMFLIMGLTVFYIVNVFRNEQVDRDKKVLWAVVLFLGNLIAMPVYWYLYLWRPATAALLSPRGALNEANASTWAGSATSPERSGAYVPPREPPDWR
jgi:hypothetical protein